MLGLYRHKNKPTNRLEHCANNYSRWLNNEKKFFNKNSSVTYNQLEKKLTYLLKLKKFNIVIPNKKLVSFISKVVFDRKIFDYSKLRFVEK